MRITQRVNRCWDRTCLFLCEGCLLSDTRTMRVHRMAGRGSDSGCIEHPARLLAKDYCAKQVNLGATLEPATANLVQHLPLACSCSLASCDKILTISVPTLASVQDVASSMQRLSRVLTRAYLLCTRAQLWRFRCIWR